MRASNTAVPAWSTKRRRWDGWRASSSPCCRSRRKREMAKIIRRSGAGSTSVPARSAAALAVAAMRRAVIASLALAIALCSGALSAERIKDLASIQGVRPNQLVGYGLVVGLDGSGDQTTQTPFTTQSLQSMLTQLGITLPQGTGNTLQLRNVAAVMVTATLPPFAQPGQQVDITVSSLGNA